jgi:hypothetical protein
MVFVFSMHHKVYILKRYETKMIMMMMGWRRKNEEGKKRGWRRKNEEGKKRGWRRKNSRWKKMRGWRRKKKIEIYLMTINKMV